MSGAERSSISQDVDLVDQLSTMDCCLASLFGVQFSATKSEVDQSQHKTASVWIEYCLRHLLWQNLTRSGPGRAQLT